MNSIENEDIILTKSSKTHY